MKTLDLTHLCLSELILPQQRPRDAAADQPHDALLGRAEAEEVDAAISSHSRASQIRAK